MTNLWLQDFFEKQNNSEPDGRFLYEYKISKADYSSLKQELEKSLWMELDVCSERPSWCAMFVLYASVWWRKEYSGNWGWEDLFNSLSITEGTDNPKLREKLVINGLSFWKHKTKVINGRRQFLGTLALQGGLPLHVIEIEKNSWLKRVLLDTLRKKLKNNINIEGRIGDLFEKQQVPKIYNNSDIQMIVLQIVEQAFKLRKKNNLSSYPDPIGYLNKKQPNWREGFALPLDEGVAIHLLDDLIKDSSNKTVTLGLSDTVRMQRFLSTDKQTFLNKISFTDENITLPSNLSGSNEIVIRVVECDGHKKRIVNERKAIKYNKNYRIIDTNTLKFYSKRKINVEFRNLDSTTSTVITACKEFDYSKPAVFINSDDGYIFKRQGSFKCRDSSLTIYIPDKATFDENDIYEISSFGCGMIVEIDKNFICLTNDGDYEFLVNADYSDEVEFFLEDGNNQYSKQIRLLKQLNPDLYVSRPKLIEYNTELESGREVSRRSLFVFDSTGKKEYSTSFLSNGIFKITHKDSTQNFTLFNEKISVIDSKFNYKIIPNNATVGSIIITHNDILKVSLNNNDIKTSIVEKNSMIKGYKETKIDLETDKIHEYIDIYFERNDQIQPMCIIFPYPAEGVIVFDAQNIGHETSERCSFNIGVQRLYEYYLKFAFSDNCRKLVTLSFELQDKNGGSIIAQDKKLEISSDELTYSLNDWKDIIVGLFGLTQDLDAKVNIAVYDDGNKLLNLNIERYETALIVDKGLLQSSLSHQFMKNISLNKLNNVELEMFNLLDIERKRNIVDGLQTEGNQRGVWNLHQLSSSNEPWLICPSKNSSVYFRPYLYYTPSNDNISPSDALRMRSAIAINEEKTRKEEIEKLLNEMSCDFDHNDWSYIHSLILKSIHLPLSTFDVWDCASKNTKFIVALLYHLSIKWKNILPEFIIKLRQEFPLIEEMVPASHWVDTFPKKYRDIEEYIYLDINKQKLMPQCYSGTNNNFITEQLLYILAEFLNELLNRHDEQDWPEWKKEEINELFEVVPEKIKGFLSIDKYSTYMHSVIQLPVILAYFSNQNIRAPWFDDIRFVYRIKQYKLFDPDWFECAFNISFTYFKEVMGS